MISQSLWWLAPFLAYTWAFLHTKLISLQISSIKGSQHKLRNNFAVIISTCNSPDCGIIQSNSWIDVRWKASVHKCFSKFSWLYIFSLQLEHQWTLKINVIVGFMIPPSFSKKINLCCLSFSSLQYWSVLPHSPTNVKISEVFW